MIGQTQLQSRIGRLIENGTFPRFSIFVGPRGCGKKTFIREVINDLTNGFFVEVGIRVDDIRELISNAYRVQSTAITTYFISDADNMSNAAKNALLKVTEEPPNNAYFIMTLEDENNTLETIRSRGTVFHMDRYTPDEILEYSKTVFGMEKLDSGTRQKIIDLCETPGDVNILNKCGLYEFYDYVKLVVDNIAEVSTANAFKIPSKVALKEDAEGYDLKLFLKAFMKVCFEMGRYNGIYTTSKYLRQLKIKGVNKQMLLDNWLLEIRELWM